MISQLPYRHDLPTVDETTQKRLHWLEEEQKAQADGDVEKIRECRANSEQMDSATGQTECSCPGKNVPHCL